MTYIDQKILISAPVKYEEDIESVTIFPQIGEVEVKTYKRFYDASGEVIRTEAGTTEKFKHNVSELSEQLRTIMKSRRKK